MNIDYYIKLADCKKGYLYKISSRNLMFGVFDGFGGFIGIREKFSNRYLDIEYHYDGEGTVLPMIELGPIPDGIETSEWLINPDKDGRPMNKALFDYLDSIT